MAEAGGAMMGVCHATMTFRLSYVAGESVRHVGCVRLRLGMSVRM